MKNKSLVVVALVATLGLAIGPALATPVANRTHTEAADHTVSVAANGTDVWKQEAGASTVARSSELSLELLSPYLASSSGGGYTQEPTVTTSQDVTFDGGDQYRIVVHDQDRGGSISVTPPENAVWNASSSLSIFVRDGSGELSSNAAVWGAEYHSGLAMNVEGNVTRSGLVNQSVALVDAQTGETIAETDSQPYLVGYNQSVSITETDSRSDSRSRVNHSLLALTSLSGSTM